jgi:hypothetical protein
MLARETLKLRTRSEIDSPLSRSARDLLLPVSSTAPNSAEETARLTAEGHTRSTSGCHISAVFETLVTGSCLHAQPHCSKPLYETRVVGFDVACTDV